MKNFYNKWIWLILVWIPWTVLLLYFTLYSNPQISSRNIFTDICAGIFIVFCWFYILPPALLFGLFGEPHFKLINGVRQPFGFVGYLLIFIFYVVASLVLSLLFSRRK